ncbi:putative HK97 family phage major capsid protein [Tenacibaculum sp. 190524A02b]|uniref:phage major capsid protein n=1 Tax=Tenacibaculum vairaonense TaxID=3137860 RepID=UPI0032B229A9
MKTYKELKEERGGLLGKQESLVNLAKKENRDLTPEEEQRFDDYQSQIEALDPKIARAKLIGKIEAEEARSTGENISAPNINTGKKEDRTFSLTRAMRSVVNDGKVSGVELEAWQESRNELTGLGLDAPQVNVISIPSSMIEDRSQSVFGDDGKKGGKLVVTEAPRMVAPLFPNNPLSELGVTHLSGLQGNVPLLSNTDVEFYWASENEKVSTSTDADFDGPVLKPKRIVAIVDISHQLMFQSSVNIEVFIINLLNNAYGRSLAAAILNGPGGKAPTGILNLEGVLDLGRGVTDLLDPSYVDIVALETAIESNNATDNNLAYVTNKALKGKLKVTAKVKGTDSVMLSDGKLLNESKLVSTNIIPDLSGGNPLIFGDWSQVFTGSWGGISITVDNLTQVASGKIRLVVNAYADMQVVHPEAFAFNKKFKVL